MAASMSWWRSWHGAPTDLKWPVIAARSGVKVGIVSAVAWALFDYASQQNERGSVVGFDTEEYAIYSGFSEDEIKAVIKAMEEKGIIVNNRLANWEKRQPKREDDSAERVRRYRDMKRDVTHGNASASAETHQIKSKSTDKEVVVDDNDAPNWVPLSKAFTEATAIPELTGGPDLFYKALEAMATAGVEPEDITAAVGEMRGRGYTIATIRSIVNPAIQAMSRRKKPGTGPPTVDLDSYAASFGFKPA